MRAKIFNTIKSAICEYEEAAGLRDFWNEPIIEIISAKNEKILALKEVVSPEHVLPGDYLSDAKSIICFFIPFHESIVNSNVEGRLASTEWALSYIKTNDLIRIINDKIEELMAKNGCKTGKIPATHDFDEKKLISNWSHRHLAYIAGLGTFGINNMLITEKGCCGRVGSVITNYEFSEYKQSGKIMEKCLNKRDGSCGMCRKRCGVNAYENNNFDRFRCYQMCLENAEFHKNIGFADICGKCMAGLPCSIKMP